LGRRAYFYDGGMRRKFENREKGGGWIEGLTRGYLGCSGSSVERGDILTGERETGGDTKTYADLLERGRENTIAKAKTSNRRKRKEKVKQSSKGGRGGKELITREASKREFR